MDILPSAACRLLCGVATREDARLTQVLGSAGFSRRACNRK